MDASLSDLYQEKEDNPYNFFLFYIFSRPLYLILCRGSKLALLHRVKERKTPSLSAQSSFAPFSLKVAWSGKSLILRGGGGALVSGGPIPTTPSHPHHHHPPLPAQTTTTTPTPTPPSFDPNPQPHLNQNP